MTFVERTFCVDTENGHKEWMEAIQSVADKILQEEYKSLSDPSLLATDTVNGSQEKSTIKVQNFVM